MPHLNLDLGYFSNRKVKRLVGLLGRGAEVLPIRLWCYCGMHHAESGGLTDYTPQEIESIAEWWGKPGEMVSAMVRVGLLEKRECGGFAIHDWIETQGHLGAFQRRAKAAAAARWGHATSNASSNAKSVDEHSPNQPDQPTNQRPAGAGAKGPDSRPSSPAAVADEPDPIRVAARQYLHTHPRLIWTQRQENELTALVRDKGWRYVEAAVDGCLDDGEADPIHKLATRRPTGHGRNGTAPPKRLVKTEIRGEV